MSEKTLIVKILASARRANSISTAKKSNSKLVKLQSVVAKCCEMQLCFWGIVDRLRPGLLNVLSLVSIQSFSQIKATS